MDDRERRFRDESTSNCHGWYKFVCLYNYVCRNCSRQSTGTRHIRVGRGVMNDRERRLRDESASNYYGRYKFVCLYGHKYASHDCSRQSTSTRHIHVGRGIRDDKERLLQEWK